MVVTLALAGSSGASSPPFSMTDLGALDPGAWPVAISHEGRVAAQLDDHAFAWTHAGGTVDLGTLGGTSSYALTVTDDGRIFGISTTASGEMHAFAWTDGGKLTDLGNLPAVDRVNINAVSQAGQIVGYVDSGSGEIHAFSWTHAGGMVDLGTLGGPESSAWAVSDAGQVVGWADTASGDWHAFSWTAGGSMVDLGTLGGADSQAEAVGNNGQVVGEADTALGGSHAFSWTPESGMVDIGRTAVPELVGDHGQVIGWFPTSSSGSHLFSWTQAGGMLDAGALGESGLWANDVSGSGQVVGATGRAFSWTQSGGIVDLGTLSDACCSAAFTVTDTGDVYGWSDQSEADTTVHIIVWHDVLAPSVPSVPELAAVSDDGSSTSDHVTSITALQLAGSAEPSSSVTLYRDGSAVATGAADVSGVWSISDAVPGVGVYSYTVTATDGAGNVSPVSESLLVTVVASESQSSSGGGGSVEAAPVEVVSPEQVPVAVPVTVPSVAQPVFVVRPVIGRPVLVPARLVAGRPAAVVFRVTRSDTGTALAKASMVADPLLGGKLIAHREQFKKGIATLRFTVPRSGKGKVLRVRLTVKLGGQTATRIGAFPIG